MFKTCLSLEENLIFRRFSGREHSRAGRPKP
jgi:hypothetical protein